MSSLSIHDAFQGFGEIKRNNGPANTSQQELTVPPPPKKGEEVVEGDDGRYPSDASYSNFPLKIRCPKCRVVSVTRMSSEMGAAAWVWCILLSPFACAGISCLCL
jgi:hypothetical protein